MSPRFVDINADGYSDLVVSGYDGVVQIGYGTGEGFKKAERIEDRDGEPVALSKYYDLEKKENQREVWQYLIKGSKAHGTSVHPVDWDGDGDFDLLFCDSGQGGLYLKLNEGTAESPVFAPGSTAVNAGDQPVKLKSLTSDALVVDWNGDGLFDIILGGLSGGIYLLENSGQPGSPEFSAPQILIRQVKENVKPKRLVTVRTNNNLPAEPGTGFHMEVVDYDRDGKLDLLIGGRSNWNLDEIEGMTEEEEERAARLEAKRDQLAVDVGAVYLELKSAPRGEKAALSKKAGELNVQMRQADRKLQGLLAKLKPRRLGDFVWLFRSK